jgi:outer membrane receptor protein involved in Fe transport
MSNQLWYSHYFFNLISNFSFYYYFPATGDEFRQYERRDLGGYNGKISKSVTVGNTTFVTTVGLGSRYDHVSPLELDHTENGQFLGYLQYGRAKELNLNGYIHETVTTGNWLFDAGLRIDYFHYNYINLSSDMAATNIFNGVDPSAAKAIVSPKLSAEYVFNDQVQLYIKAGKGFHSNDVRVVIAKQGFEILPAAYGADLGINWKPLPNLFINTAAWYLFLQQEFTFGSDLVDQPAGPVGPSGKTVRVGIDLSARYSLTARGYFITDMAINYTRKNYEIGISVENLFNHQWDEAQFGYTSRLKGEAAPVDQVSYTPGVPFFAKIRFSVFF